MCLELVRFELLLLRFSFILFMQLLFRRTSFLLHLRWFLNERGFLKYERAVVAFKLPLNRALPDRNVKSVVFHTFFKMLQISVVFFIAIGLWVIISVIFYMDWTHLLLVVTSGWFYLGFVQALLVGLCQLSTTLFDAVRLTGLSFC